MLNQNKHIYELENIRHQLVIKFKPNKIILFGSLAKGVITKNSDIDICIIIDTDNKRQLISDIYLEVDSSCPFDIVLYTTQEWQQHIKDKTSFAYKIMREGKILYGG